MSTIEERVATATRIREEAAEKRRAARDAFGQRLEDEYVVWLYVWNEAPDDGLTFAEVVAGLPDIPEKRLLAVLRNVIENGDDSTNVLGNVIDRDKTVSVPHVPGYISDTTRLSVDWSLMANTTYGTYDAAIIRAEGKESVGVAPPVAPLVNVEEPNF